MPYALGRITYGGRLGTQGTDPDRRGDIGVDVRDRRSPHKGVSTQPVEDTRPRFFANRGGSGDMRLQAIRRTATPTDRRILTHSYLILTLGPDRSDKAWSQRGEAEGEGATEDCCKGKEQPEGASRLDRADLHRQDTPRRGGWEELEGVFS